MPRTKPPTFGKAAFDAVDKLRRVGEALAPPTMQALQGETKARDQLGREGLCLVAPVGGGDERAGVAKTLSAWRRSL